MNIQYAVTKGDGGHRLYVLEVNPRASRTAPFVSKATGVAYPKVAAKIMAGETLASQGVREEVVPGYSSVKESVFPFARFPGVDIALGPEMKSTGEVMGIAEDFAAAFAKAQIGAGIELPTEGAVFVSMASDADKRAMVEPTRRLTDLGFHVIATSGTAAVLRDAGIKVEVIRKIQEGRPNLLDRMANGEVQFIFNTPSRRGPDTDEGRIRAASVANKIPSVTTLPGCQMMVRAVEALIAHPAPEVRALQDWHAGG